MSDHAGSEIGNTLTMEEIVFEGNPFPSSIANADVLTALFPDGDIQPESEGSSKSSQVILTFKRKGIGPQGRVTKCTVEDDGIMVEYALPPSTIDQLSKNLKATQSSLDKMVTGLLQSYAIQTKPRVYRERWMGTSQNVPCVAWLKKQSILKVSELHLDDLTPPGSEIEVRSVGTAFAFHIFQKGTQDLPPEFRNKLQLISKIEVSVATGEDWENGHATVQAVLRGLQRDFYTSFLRMVTTKT